MLVLDQAGFAFVSLRLRLFGIPCRILRNSTDAEDIVQEVWLRWQATDCAVVANPPAFLATTTTRLAIKVAQFARSRSEACGGTWLPEPSVSADAFVRPG
jgi:RNA polymerase sigma-70 factor, ECF subfamily